MIYMSRYRRLETLCSLNILNIFYSEIFEKKNSLIYISNYGIK